MPRTTKIQLAESILKMLDPTIQTIEPYQVDFIQSGNRKIPGRLVVKSRRLGISTIVAVEATLDALLKPRWSVLFISKSDDDAKDLLDRVRDALKGICINPHLLGLKLPGKDWEERYKDLVPDRDNKSFIKLKNGSTLRSVAASGDSARGKTANRVYLDEFAAVNPPNIADEIWKGAVPTTKTTRGMVTVISTPKGKDNKFAKLWFDEELPYERFHLPFSVCSRLVEIEDELRREFTEIEFEQEFNCSFDVLEGGLWTTEELNALDVPPVDEESISRGTNVLAWDPAQSQDKSAVVIIQTESGMKRVVHLEDLSEMDYPSQAQRVLLLESIYKPTKVVLDNSGVGSAVADLLKPIERKVVRVNATKELNAEMMLSIKSEADSGRFKICRSKWSEVLKRDLFAFSMDKKAFPHIRSKRFGHHDFGSSLLLAYTEIKKLRRTMGIWTPNRSLRGMYSQKGDSGWI